MLSLTWHHRHPIPARKRDWRQALPDVCPHKLRLCYNARTFCCPDQRPAIWKWRQLGILVSNDRPHYSITTCWACLSTLFIGLLHKLFNSQIKVRFVHWLRRVPRLTAQPTPTAMPANVFNIAALLYTSRIRICHTWQRFFHSKLWIIVIINNSHCKNKTKTQ